LGRHSAPLHSRMAHVENVAIPRPGACFRWVHDQDKAGYPTPCGAPVRWRGMWKDPRGKRHTVDACDEHVGGVANPRHLTADDLLRLLAPPLS
jgi:hypothetical protein